MKRLDWKTVPIKELYEGLYDGPHATPKLSDSGPVFLGIKNVTDDGRLDLAEIRHIAEDDYAAWTRRVEPHPGDLVFTYEATLNRYALIPNGFRGCLGRRMALIRTDPRRVDVRFLLYYFFTEEWRAVIRKNMLTGATVDRIPLTSFPDFPVKAPQLSVQQRIADVLSAYDELIENNQRRIQILETMARALYREWFVEFRFPGSENVPRVASSIGDIPKGWEVKKLAAVAEVNRAKINVRNAPDELHYIDISSVGPGEIREITTYAFADAPGRARRVVQHGDVLWSCVRPNRRSYAQVIHPEPGTIASTGFAVLTASAMPFTFLYFAATTDDFVGYLTNHATGAAYPAVTATTFEDADLLMPSAPLLARFGEATIAMTEKTHALKRQIHNLRRTRDLLLPRLLSGQVARTDTAA